MLNLHFDPVDIQSTGVGLAAFLATVLTLFVFLSARNEKLGRAMYLMLGACMVWAWFGFFYHVIPTLWLARDMRIISVMGIVLICASELHFALEYLSERMERSQRLEHLSKLLYAAGAALLMILAADFGGTHLVVGELSLPTSEVLAPKAGPVMAVLIGYYVLMTAISGVLLALRSRLGHDETDKRQAMLLFVSMTVGLTLGGLRFTPWYGFDFYPFIGDIGFPLFTFAALYSITRYRLLNLQVAAAQTLIFVLWTFTFFRVLVEPSFTAALPDIGLFITSLILGVLLLRTTIAEMRQQRELARLTLEKGKNEFATIAAHQLRTPITAVRWAFEGLKTTSLTDTQREFIETGEKASTAMSQLANDLLDIDRIEMGAFGYAKESGDLRDVLTVAGQVIGDAAKERSVHLNIALPNEALAATFDRGKIALVFENLFDNATKYTPPGGTVSVQAVRDGDRAIVSIKDSGIGIAPDEAPHMFEKFYRSDAARRAFPNGSGLGLFIAKTIVEGHGGTISAASEGRDKGTTITIRLPVQ